MKKSINTIGTIVLIILVSMFIASCDYFNRPMIDFLEEWTNMAQVSKHTFDDTYPVIGDITNVPSGKDRVITYYVINPQSYDLGIEVTFDPSLGWDPIRTDNHPDFSTTSNQGTVEQDATDKSIIRLTLNENALAGLDGDGRDISPTVSIVEPRSGRNFGSYTVPVRVNSLPPVLSNAVIMKYTDSNEKYAVCFNLPAMGSGDIHRDITQITVNGTFNGQPFNNTYQVTGGGTGTVTVDGVPESSSSDYRAIGSEFVNTGNTFVGIKTGLDLGPTTPTCTITLTDSSGATTVTAVSTVSTLLNKIYVNGDSGNDNNTGTASSPVKTIGNALEKLRDVPNGTIILQSDISLAGSMDVGSDISVRVTGEGSERTVTNGSGGVFTVTSGGSLIIGENITLTGTRGKGGCVIVDGGNFTMESGSKITGSSASPNGGIGGGVLVSDGIFTMNGGIISGNTATYGGGVSVSGGEFIMRGGTIGGNDPGSANTASYDGGGVYVDGGTFTLCGGTISGNSSSRNGGGVYADGTFSVSGTPTIADNTVNNTPNNVYLPGGKTITIGAGGLTGGTIGVTVADMKAGNAVKITDKNVTGAANRFTSDVAGYTIMEGIAPMEDAVYLFGGNIGTGMRIEVAYSSSGGKVQFGTFEEARAASATEITLLKDITPTTAPTVSWPITFKWTCTLDLNGYAINRKLTSETSDGHVIVIEANGNITIKDSSATNSDGTNGTGKITGGYPASSGITYDSCGGGVAVKGGSLILESGSITGNKSTGYVYGGGVSINGGEFTMTGGTINGNTAFFGGGVYVKGGNFTITGGTISENTATYDGDGVYVKGGTFNRQGGTVVGDVYQES